MIFECIKPIGITTVEYLNEFKKNIEYSKICFAGRLDPLAKGKLYILTDEDIYKKEHFCNKDKIYETYVVKNFTTDSYDIMGMPYISNTGSTNDFITKLSTNIPIIFDQKYPPYSSVIIKKYKKPYWLVTKQNLPLKDEDIPFKSVQIKDFLITDQFNLTPLDFLDLIIDRISNVNPSQQFRQTDIIQQWKLLLANYPSDIIISKILVTCSSGTYIRNIANYMNGCCYDINRLDYL